MLPMWRGRGKQQWFAPYCYPTLEGGTGVPPVMMDVGLGFNAEFAEKSHISNEDLPSAHSA